MGGLVLPREAILAPRLHPRQVPHAQCFPKMYLFPYTFTSPGPLLAIPGASFPKTAARPRSLCFGQLRRSAHHNLRLPPRRYSPLTSRGACLYSCPGLPANHTAQPVPPPLIDAHISSRLRSAHTGSALRLVLCPVADPPPVPPAASGGAGGKPGSRWVCEGAVTGSCASCSCCPSLQPVLACFA